MAMKRTKYIILFSAALFVSCSSGKWLDVSATVNVEELMKKECPDLYARYKKGEVEITKVEMSKVEMSAQDDKYVYRFKYSETSDDDESYLWLTIYMPTMSD